MGYIEALEAAGAVVHSDASFGSYQGDWLAFVTYKDQTGLVRGGYGSCSGCDSFAAEFDDSEGCDEHRWHEQPETCEPCAVARVESKSKLAAFGERYLDSIEAPDEVIAEFVEQSVWDMSAPEVVAWVKALTPP